MPLPELAVLASRLLDVIEHDIVPKTRDGVATGNKLFGAAILTKHDLTLVIAGTNAETENPLFHGEISALNAFYRLPAEGRPATRDCIFLSTHEPCSLCLSAITWAGFDNFFYLFGYEDTRDAFNIPHDLKILHEVFRIEHGDYARENAFWKSRSIGDLIASAPRAEQLHLRKRVDQLSKVYTELSEIYQHQKGSADIPLA
jgi:tRNA(Arg) A34 adenosine deaminase TadA